MLNKCFRNFSSKYSNKNSLSLLLSAPYIFALLLARFCLLSLSFSIGFVAVATATAVITFWLFCFTFVAYTEKYTFVFRKFNRRQYYFRFGRIFFTIWNKERIFHQHHHRLLLLLSTSYTINKKHIILHIDLSQVLDLSYCMIHTQTHLM